MKNFALMAAAATMVLGGCSSTMGAKMASTLNGLYGAGYKDEEMLRAKTANILDADVVNVSNARYTSGTRIDWDAEANGTVWKCFYTSTFLEGSCSPASTTVANAR